MTYRIVVTILAVALAALAIVVSGPRNVDEETKSVQQPVQSAPQKSEDDALKGFKLN